MTKHQPRTHLAADARFARGQNAWTRDYAKQSFLRRLPSRHSTLDDIIQIGLALSLALAGGYILASFIVH